MNSVDFLKKILTARVPEDVGDYINSDVVCWEQQKYYRKLNETKTLRELYVDSNIDDLKTKNPNLKIITASFFVTCKTCGSCCFADHYISVPEKYGDDFNKPGMINVELEESPDYIFDALANNVNQSCENDMDKYCKLYNFTINPCSCKHICVSDVTSHIFYKPKVKIVVKNDELEMHYRFTRHFKNTEMNGRINQRSLPMIFLYAHGIPTICFDTGNSHFFRFKTHELYESAIQYMIDNYSSVYDIKTQFDDKTDGSFLHFMFDDDFSSFTNYENMTPEQKIKYIKDNTHDDDNVRKQGWVIIDIDYFTEKILHYAPGFEYQRCGKCECLVHFDELFIDVRWKLEDTPEPEIDENDGCVYTRDCYDPCVCSMCLEKLSESDKPFHKQPPDDKDTISRIIGEYYFHSSLKSAKNIA